VARAAPGASAASAALAAAGAAHGKGREPLADAGAPALGALGAAAVGQRADEFLELLAARLALEFIQRHGSHPLVLPARAILVLFPAGLKERTRRKERAEWYGVLGGGVHVPRVAAATTLPTDFRRAPRARDRRGIVIRAVSRATRALNRKGRKGRKDNLIHSLLSD